MIRSLAPDELEWFIASYYDFLGHSDPRHFARRAVRSIHSVAHQLEGEAERSFILFADGDVPLAGAHIIAPGPDDDWTQVTSGREALETIVPGATVFLATGGSVMGDFAGHDGPIYCRRRGAPRACAFPAAQGGWSWARPPFEARHEIAWFRALRIDVLVTRNIGGPGAWPKVEAARALDLPVVMIETRDPPEPLVRNVADALAWVMTL